MMPTCPVCGHPFEPSGRRRHCSDACRQAAWRRRHTPTDPQPALPPKGKRRANTVYECDTCGSRALGDQRCDACNTWMRAIGLGGFCPHCDEPIAVAEITEGR
ncbi:MAG: hypothetical protein ACRDZ7_13645 [Acidimicrobiia bacterium]